MKSDYTTFIITESICVDHLPLFFLNILIVKVNNQLPTVKPSGM